MVNNAQVSLDLTCSLPIRNVLVDDRNRNFDAIEDLYKIRGNPECNKSLQPGFESDMTWIYRVPVGTNISGWAFQDITEHSSAGRTEPTIVRLQLAP